MADSVMTEGSQESSHVVAGIIGRPHGLDGSFHVVAAVAGLLPVGAAVRVAQLDREVQRCDGTVAYPIVRISGCDDRDAAEAMRGEEVLVARGEVPPLGGDEWWATDLEGCSVHDGAREVGVVHALVGLPSCEALRVRTVDGFDGAATLHDGYLLVPLVRDAVRDVDLESQRIDVDLRFLGID